MSQPSVNLLFLYAESPIHVGTSTSLGAVDLPIARERMSQLPMVPGSGLRGALRELAAAREPATWRERAAATTALFGPPPPRTGRQKQGGQGEAVPDEPNPSDFSGSVSVHDARLLLMPLRSARAGWVWATCPMILQRLNRDLKLYGQVPLPVPKVEEGRALVGPKSKVAVQGHVLVEDLALPAAEDAQVQTLAERLAGFMPTHETYTPFQKRLPEQLVLLSDTDFCELSQRGTEIQTRVRLDHDTGTVADGALWTEEALPAESMLWSLVFCERLNRSTKPDFTPQQGMNELLGQLPLLRLGGDAGTGRGLMGVRWLAAAPRKEGV